MIKNEDGRLVTYVFVDTGDADMGGYVERARDALVGLDLPAGYEVVWTGQYEFLERIRARLGLLIPLTLVLVLWILFFQFGRLSMALLVMSAVPLALIGSFWLLWLLGFNTSIAVWVGMIALVGVSAETASIMVVYLERARERWTREGRLRTQDELVACTLDAATLRLRPVLMTVTTNLVGLLPVMLFTGPGADVMQRIVAPMIGGLVTLSLLTLVVIPVAWTAVRSFSLPRTV